MFEILIATKNVGKVKELREFLSDLNIGLKDLTEFANSEEVAETGETFLDNAVLKAKGYSTAAKMWSIADDSGLEVEALGGAPGVLSARYAGVSATDDQRINKLLRELENTDNKRRQARFVCAMAVSDENGVVKFTTEGICNGRIAVKSQGTKGFGYDPVFIPEGFDTTFGQLADKIKQNLSHRAKAIREIIGFLSSFTA